MLNPPALVSATHVPRPRSRHEKPAETSPWHLACVMRGRKRLTQHGGRQMPSTRTGRKAARPAAVESLIKAPTGITGFDEITGGGLPRGRTTLLMGGPGSGKTLFALQFLVHGARNCREPGILVAFEENAKRIVANAGSFGWNLEELRPMKLFLMDAQPTPDLVQSGTFDLGGMLAVLEFQARNMRSRRIVFDALDV